MHRKHVRLREDCNVCETMEDSSTKIGNHFESCQSQFGEIVNCLECYMVHHIEKPHFQYLVSPQLNTKHHMKEERFLCKLCDSGTKDNVSVKECSEIEHGMLKIFKCVDCDYKNRPDHKLMCHIEMHHSCTTGLIHYVSVTDNAQLYHLR